MNASVNIEDMRTHSNIFKHFSVIFCRFKLRMREENTLEKSYLTYVIIFVMNIWKRYKQNEEISLPIA